LTFEGTDGATSKGWKEPLALEGTRFVSPSICGDSMGGPGELSGWELAVVTLVVGDDSVEVITARGKAGGGTKLETFVWCCV
jgi:hypothetical protein